MNLTDEKIEAAEEAGKGTEDHDVEKQNEGIQTGLLCLLAFSRII